MSVRDPTWSELLSVALFGGAAGWTTGFVARVLQNGSVVVGMGICYVAYRRGYFRGTFQADFDRLKADLPPLTLVTGLVFVGCFVWGNRLA